MSLQAKAEAICGQLRELILEQLRSESGPLRHKRGFADGYWGLIAYSDGSVVLEGYAAECADWRTLDELPLTELAHLADAALSK